MSGESPEATGPPNVTPGKISLQSLGTVAVIMTPKRAFVCSRTLIACVRLDAAVSYTHLTLPTNREV